MPRLPLLFAPSLSAVSLSIMVLMAPTAGHASSSTTPPTTSPATPSASAPAASASGGPSESASDTPAPPNPYFALHQTIADAAKAQRWDEAIAQARKLYEMSLEGQNPYELLNSSDLLYTLLYQQGQYGQALELSDQVMAQTARQENGPVSGQMEALVLRGVMAAVMAGDKVGQTRYLQALRKEAQLFAPLWQWDEAQNRIQFGAAQLSMPMSEGRWILTKLEPANDRKEFTSFQYLYLKPDGRRFITHVRLSWDERQQGLDADALKKLLDEEYRKDVEDEQRVLDLKLPSLPYPDAVQKQYATREKRGDRPDMLTFHWEALRGNWRLAVETQLLEVDRELALEQLPRLWAAMQWPKASELPAQLPRQEQEVTSAWQHERNWPKAGPLARAALTQAIYPAELARLHTVAGIADFKAGRKADAQKHLDQALQAWPYVSLHRLEADLQENAQQYAAALAAQQGRDADAAQLMRQYLRNAGGLQNIWVHAKNLQMAELENRRTGMVLPMMAAGFHLQEPVDDQRMIYRDLLTEQQMGLTMGMKIPQTAAEQEKLLRKALDRQFRIEAGALTVQPFKPQVRAGRPAAKGQQWVFAVESSSESSNTIDISGGPKRVLPKQAIFWLVDQDGTRSIMRASITSQRDLENARELMQSIKW